MYSKQPEKNVSLVIITHCKGDLLKRTLEAACECSPTPTEIILIDDGGKDWKIAQEFLSQIRYIPVEHQGYRLALMCNIGIQISSGDVILKIDGDCIPARSLIDAAIRVQDDELVSFRVDWDEGGRVRPDWRFKGSTLNPVCRAEPERYFWGGAIAASRQTFLDLGGFREDLFSGMWGGEEVDIALRARSKEIRVRLEGSTGVIHQYHPRPKGGGEKKLGEAQREYEQGRYPQPLFPFEDAKIFSDIKDEYLRKVLFAQIRASNCQWTVMVDSLSWPWLKITRHRARHFLSLVPPENGILHGKGVLFSHHLVRLS